jgi:hypothetical protein
MISYPAISQMFNQIVRGSYSDRPNLGFDIETYFT